jgi:pimeloyl-ACP methyl ester carboxylesterase
LAEDFTVFNYDRRGRDDSGDVQRYAVEREIEDLDAVISQTGGQAAVFGNSSGAVLAMQAAAAGLPITRLAMVKLPVSTSSRVNGPSIPGLRAAWYDRTWIATLGRWVAASR